MIIPKTFKLFGRTFKVTQPWKVDAKDNRGGYWYSPPKVAIQRSLDRSEKEVVYLHEVTHVILEALEYNDLSADEQFVETFSRALHQVLTSQE